MNDKLLKEAFEILKANPILADVTSLIPDVKEFVVHLYDQNGRHRVSLPRADYEALLRGEWDE